MEGNLTTTDPNATIHDKNDIPFNKSENKVNVQVGETVEYVIETKVPDTTGFSKYTFNLSDKMSAGLTFQQDVKISIGGVADTRDDKDLVTQKNADGDPLDKKYYSLEQTADGFEIVFNAMDMTKGNLVGKLIKVRYTAIANENAVSKVENNHAELIFSNDPTKADQTDKLEDEEPVYTAKIVIDKYDADSSPKQTLAGAEFVLRRVKTPGSEGVDPTYEYYVYENEMVSWTDSMESATHYTTGEDGMAQFVGLKDGDYELVETKAPEGYNLLTTPVTVVIEGNKDGDLYTNTLPVGLVTATKPVVDGAIAELKVTTEVPNSTGLELPDTGGIGTTIFYVVGGFLVVAAGILLVTQKRMSSQD